MTYMILLFRLFYKSHLTCAWVEVWEITGATSVVTSASPSQTGLGAINHRGKLRVLILFYFLTMNELSHQKQTKVECSQFKQEGVLKLAGCFRCSAYLPLDKVPNIKPICSWDRFQHPSCDHEREKAAETRKNWTWTCDYTLKTWNM